MKKLAVCHTINPNSKTSGLFMHPLPYYKGAHFKTFGIVPFVFMSRIFMFHYSLETLVQLEPNWLECSLYCHLKSLWFCWSEVSQKRQEAQRCQKGCRLSLYLKFLFLTNLGEVFFVMFLIKLTFLYSNIFFMAITISKLWGCH